MHRHARSLLGVGVVLLLWLTLGPTVAQERWYEVYFSQVDNDPEHARANLQSIDRMLAEKLGQAQSRIDAALHELDSDRLTTALLAAHQRGVRVRLVTEHDYEDEVSIAELRRAGIPIVTDGGRAGLMHHKFIVVDARYVWTGSFNATDNGAYKNNNNAIWIDASELAANFLYVFTEMFDTQQFAGSASFSLPYPLVTMPDSTTLSSFFAPQQDVASVLSAYLREAQHSIIFMAFSFTHEALGEVMRERFRAGVDVRGVFETRGSNVAYSQYPAMHVLGMPVMQDTNRWSMHHKVIIIDGQTVITGSFNFSRNAAHSNNENVLIVAGNRDIARLYTEEFQRVSGTTGAPETPPSSPADLVPINTAPQTQLENLPGIGPVLAQRIIAARPYRSLQDLDRVPGLGPGKLAVLKERITFE
jgi:phosphatidylserine/phosphatidylglycerophosphate/cardiolipin synthase-like enzyme